MVTVERFSSSYSVVNGARAIPYTGETVRMDQRLLVDLQVNHGFPNPTLKVGGGHYEPIPTDDVLADTVAIPQDVYQGESVMILNPENENDKIPIF